MNKIISLLLILSFYFVEGQTNLTKESDTLFWKNSVEVLIKDFKIEKKDSNSDFTFRNWNIGYLIDVYKKNDSVNASINFFVYEIWNDNYKADTYSKTYLLPKKTSEKLYKYIRNTSINKIPSDKYIKDWKQGFDGNTDIYEIQTPKSYSFKKYWTPTAQEKIEEAKLIKEFKKNIKEIVKFENYKDNFEETIPFVAYKYPWTGISVMKVLTKKEYIKYKQKRRKNKK